MKSHSSAALHLPGLNALTFISYVPASPPIKIDCGEMLKVGVPANDVKSSSTKFNGKS